MFTGYGESWRPPLFKIGKVPFNLVATIILAEVICTIAMVFVGQVGFEKVFFNPADFLQGELWRVVTYPLFEAPSFWWMLSLFFFYRFGSQLEMQLGRPKLIKLILALITIPLFISLILYFLTGASGRATLFGNSITHLGTFIGFCAMMPNAQSFFGIKLKWFGLAFAALAFFQFLSLPAYGMALSLLAGSAFAVFFVQRQGFTEGFKVREEIFGPNTRKKSKGQAKRRPRQEKKLRPRTKVDTTSATEVDRILDKINDQGFQSLTEREKETLEKSAKN